ncbi:hypothetical protein CD201_18905 [Hafnia alvei]|nr:hypothetical protein CD201_18905 [Hafnia alvei]
MSSWCKISSAYSLCDHDVRFRPPISNGIHIQTKSKASDEGRQRAPLQSSRFLSVTPSPLRFGIAHPGRPKLRRYIPVPAALPTKT